PVWNVLVRQHFPRPWWTFTALLRILHWVEDLQQALDTPVFHTNASPSSFHPRETVPGDLAVEPGGQRPSGNHVPPRTPLVPRIMRQDADPSARPRWPSLLPNRLVTAYLELVGKSHG